MKNILFIMSLLLVVSTGIDAQPIRVGLFVGVNNGHYFDDPLFYAHKDAEKFNEVISRFGGLQTELSMLLKEPSADGLREKLSEMKERISLVRRYQNEQVECLFYYSGHSGIDGLHIQENTIPFKELYQSIEGMGCNLRIVILDACNSGGILGLKGVTYIEEKRVDLHNSDQGEVIITSSAANEYSQEKDELRGSIFTYYLVNGLLGEADYNGDHLISLSEAYNFAYKSTLKETFGRNKGMQHPSYRYEIKGQNDIALTSLDTETGNISLPADVGATYTFLDVSRGLVLGEFAAKSHARTIRLPLGQYVVKHTTHEGELRVASISVGHEPINLENLAFNEVEQSQDPIKGERTRYIFGLGITGGIEHGVAGSNGDLLPPFLYGGELGFNVDGLIIPHQTLGIHFGFYHGEIDGTLYNNPREISTMMYELAIDIGFIWNLASFSELATKVSAGLMILQWNNKTPFFEDSDIATGFRGGLALEHHLKLNRAIMLVLPGVRGMFNVFKDSADLEMTYMFNPGVYLGINVVF